MIVKPYLTNNKTMLVPFVFVEDLNQYFVKNIEILTFDENHKAGIYSLFNKSIVLTKYITTLVLGHCFNKPIDLTRHLTVLTFGGCFNQPIILTPCITVLTFGNYFNQLIVLTPKIILLTFGNHFNQPITLSKNITHLTLGRHFNHSIILTLRITHLTLGYGFKHQIILTPNIIVLTIDCNNYTIIDNLTNGTKHLVFGSNCILPLGHVPNSVEKINIWACERERLINAHPMTKICFI